MNITALIIENLRAMGANPEKVTRPDGSTEIKVNAPTVTGGNNEKTENKKG